MLSPCDYAKLSGADRRWLEAKLAEFEHSWTPGQLALWAHELPPRGTLLRWATLAELVRLDLPRQWQQGRHITLEAYLKAYPEVGTAATIPAALILAEWEARCRCGGSADLTEFKRRFPEQAEELQRLLTRAKAQADAPLWDATRATRSLLCQLTPSPIQPVGTPQLPEQFGRYRIMKQLGQGGMGTVYLAYDTQLERPVALKVPHFADTGDPDVLARFAREARLAATIVHPHICPVHDVGTINGIAYVTMAYIEGKPLSEMIQAGKLLPPRPVAAVVRKMALALEEAHRHGVVHRDLKPSNVMINQRNEPVIMDFGLARRLGKDDERLTQTGSLLGTPAYMAPEQVEGDANALGPACDIYSLGVILYELLTGKLPFQGPTAVVLGQILSKEPVPLSWHRPDVDPVLEGICLKAMAKRPGNRYASMSALATALARFLKEDSQAPRGGGTDLPVVLPIPEPIPFVVPVSPRGSGSVPRSTPADPVRPAPRPPFVTPVSRSQHPEAVLRVTPVSRRSPPPRARLRARPRSRSYAGCLLLVFLVLALAAGGGAVYWFQFSAHAYYQRGVSLARDGDDDGAIAAYTKAIERDDKMADAYVGRAECLFRKADDDRVMNDCNAALALDGKQARAYCYRGGASNRLGDFDKAIADCNEAIRLDGSLALAYAFRGAAYAYLTKYDEALDDLNKAIALDSKLALAYAYRSDIYGDLGDLDRALADSSRAIELEPRLGIAYAYRGHLHSLKGEKAQAQADLDKALQLAPNEAEVYNSRGCSQLDNELAVEDFRKAIALRPRFAIYHSNLGLQLTLKDPVEALKEASRAIEISPTSAGVYWARGWMHYLKGPEGYQDAQEDMRQTIRLNPKYSLAYYLRGQIYLAQDRLDEALADFNQAIKLNPSSCEYYLYRADTYLRRKDTSPEATDQVIRDYLQALKLGLTNETDLSTVYSYLEEAYRKKGDAEQALIYRSKYLALHPEELKEKQ